MGCDYYTITELEVKFVSNDNNHNEVQYIIIPLSKQSRWFFDYPYDSDDPDAPDRDEYYESQLEPSSHMIVYDGKWKSQHAQEKYEDTIHSTIGDHHVIIVRKHSYSYRRY